MHAKQVTGANQSERYGVQQTKKHEAEQQSPIECEYACTHAVPCPESSDLQGYIYYSVRRN